MKEVNVRIEFDNLTKEQEENVMKAEEYLRKAGLSFDTGGVDNHRDWEFDWSLKGAKVYLKDEK